MIRSLAWFRSQFPDSLYPCVADRQSEYVERVLSGYEIASRSSVCIAGLVRDCEKILPSTLARITSLANHFFDVSFCIYENDSTDLSKQILLEWSSGIPEAAVKCQNLGFKKHGSVKTEERIKDMAFCRTKLQEMVKHHAAPIDYVVLLDMDIEGGFSIEGILNSLSYPYDCLASNSLIYEQIEGKTIRYYYDSYGLKLYNTETDEEKNKLLFHRGEQPVGVASAFGGLAVYKYSTYSGGQYSVPDFTRYCEHIPFHQNMRCYLNPSQITLYSKSRYSV